MLFVGDDWAEDHHDVEVQDESGRRLGKDRLPEGIAGLSGLHALISRYLPEDAEPGSVVIGIETDRGPWVAALVMAGYQVFAINPRQVARFKERYTSSGAKSDAADAHALADMVRTERHQLRPIAGDSADSEAIRVVARAHQGLIWERTRHTLRLRSALREFFPAALEAFADLAAPEALELLAQAPEPTTAAALTSTQIMAALQRARRRGDLAAKAEALRAALGRPQLTQPTVITAAYAATVRAQVAILVTLTEQIKHLEEGVEAHFGRHPDAEIYLSQPGIGMILGARVLGEFGDDPTRYASAKSRKNYAGTSPITRQSGKSRIVLARFVHNDRLIDALLRQAFCALTGSPGARAYYDQLRHRGLGHHAALRQLANRLVGILHGCLKTHTPYDEATAWPTPTNKDQQDAA